MARETWSKYLQGMMLPRAGMTKIQAIVREQQLDAVIERLEKKIE